MTPFEVQSDSGDSIIGEHDGSVYSCTLQGIDDCGSFNGEVVAKITKRPNGRWDLFMDDGEDGIIEIENGSLQEVYERLVQWNSDVQFMSDPQVLEMLFVEILGLRI